MTRHHEVESVLWSVFVTVVPPSFSLTDLAIIWSSLCVFTQHDGWESEKHHNQEREVYFGGNVRVASAEVSATVLRPAP